MTNVREFRLSPQIFSSRFRMEIFPFHNAGAEIQYMVCEIWCVKVINTQHPKANEKIHTSEVVFPSEITRGESN